jgi:hypothetical protein
MMNERIQELAWSIGIAGKNFQGQIDTDWNQIEKFAELIIRECLGDHKERIALRYQGSEKDRDIGYGMEIVYYDIVEKFGVEE